MSVKPIQRAETNSLAKGLATDLGLLSYPPDVSLDERNFDMMKDGSRRRRLGMDREVGGDYVNPSISNSLFDTNAINGFVWRKAGGKDGVDIYVCQIGSNLTFFNINAPVVSSPDGYMGKVSTLQLSNATPWGMATADKYLVVAGGTSEVMIVDFDPVTQTFTTSTAKILIRDQFGIQETIEPRYETDKTYRGELNPQHYYNLYNQGWGIPRYDWKKTGNALDDAVKLGGNGGDTKVPSNSDKVWSGMAFRPVGTDVDGFENQVECFHYTQFEAITGADTEAAKGFFIIDAFRRSTSRQSAWADHLGKYPEAGLMESFSAPTDITLGGPTIVCSHAGRVFYAGVQGTLQGGDSRSPGYNSTIFFSQVVREKRDISKCYQEGDPTSRDSNDLVESDGGFISIAEASNILGMFSLGARLFVIASNGLWSITGGSDYGFSATNYKVDKLSTFGGISSNSVVVIGDAGYYWAYDGIVRVARNEMGDYSATTISDHIKTFYDDIPVNTKVRSRGIYDSYSKRVSWVYQVREEDKDPSSEVEEGNWELFLEIGSGAFFPYHMRESNVWATRVIGGFEVPPVRSITYVEPVIKTDLQDIYRFTLDDPDEQIATRVVFKYPSDATIKYIVLVDVEELSTLGVVVTQYANIRYRDWEFIDQQGRDAHAYLLTGDQTTGDVAINKQIPYLTMVLENTDEGVEVEDSSSCMARCQWGFTDSPNSGRWTRPMQLYRHRRAEVRGLGEADGHKLVISKTKLRGRGKAFALYLETEEYKDCRIIGWNITLTRNDVT